MKPKRARTDTVRAALWTIMRVYRTFTIPQLIEVLIERYPTMTYDNTQKFVRRLVNCGHVAKIGTYRGGRPGRCQEYQLRSNEIQLPVLGIGRTENLLKKEKEKEREKESETETGGEA